MSTFGPVRARDVRILGAVLTITMAPVHAAHAVVVRASAGTAASPSPSPRTFTNEDLQPGPAPLLLVCVLLVAAFLLGRSMRTHLRRVPVDLDVRRAGAPQNGAVAADDPVAPDASGSAGAPAGDGTEPSCG